MSYHYGRTSSYATEAEIVASCAVYDFEIFVQKNANQNHEWQKFSANFDDSCTHQKPFICLINSGDHYNLLRRSQRPCSCQNLNPPSTSNEPSYKEALMTHVNINNPKRDQPIINPAILQQVVKYRYL